MLLDRKSPIPIRIHSKELTRENRDYGMRREQAAYIAIMVVIIALQVFIFLPIWFGTGVILLWTKADAMRGVWDVWYFVWTMSREFDSDENVVVDTHILNGSLFAHFILESIPNMTIQIVNNIQLQAPYRKSQ